VDSVEEVTMTTLQQDLISELDSSTGLSFIEAIQQITPEEPPSLHPSSLDCDCDYIQQRQQTLSPPRRRLFRRKNSPLNRSQSVPQSLRVTTTADVGHTLLHVSSLNPVGADAEAMTGNLCGKCLERRRMGERDQLDWERDCERELEMKVKSWRLDA